MEPRLTTARRVVEQVPLRRPERRAQRDGPERRPTDAEHDDVGELAGTQLHPLHVVERLLVECAVLGKVEEAERSARILVRDAAVRLFEARCHIAPLGFRDPTVDRRGHHVRVVQADRHRQTGMESPSYAGTMPGGSSASRSAWKLSCVRCVRYVISAPIARAAAIASSKLRCEGCGTRNSALI